VGQGGTSGQRATTPSNPLTELFRAYPNHIRVYRATSTLPSSFSDLVYRKNGAVRVDAGATPDAVLAAVLSEADAAQLETALRGGAVEGPLTQALVWVLHPGLKEAAVTSAAAADFHVYVSWPASNGAELQLLVRPSYNPMEHAQALLDAGRPFDADAVLAMIPPVYLQQAARRVRINVQRLVCLRAAIDAAERNRAADLSFLARYVFTQVMAEDPRHGGAIESMTGIWRAIEQEAMAGCLERTQAFLRGASAPTAGEPAPVESERGSAFHAAYDRTDDSDAPALRLLFIVHPRPHYGIDVLYDGLCAALGRDAVTDWPYKPTLHGAPPEKSANYPCMFDWPGTPHSFETIQARLRAGEFDAVLFGDCEGVVDRAQVMALAEASPDVPWFLVDQMDEFQNLRPLVSGRLGGRAFALYFKREMLPGIDYGPDTYPLPFAFAEAYLPQAVPTQRTRSIFWAGHRDSDMRRLYLEHAERRFGLDLGKKFTPEAYKAALLDARVGLNLFGFGFDTVRYWEVPAHGALLLSAQPPTIIPNNFVHGESALFFGDLAVYDRVIQGVLSDAYDLEGMAAAGRAHFLRYHTGRARAQQMLGLIASGIVKSV